MKNYIKFVPLLALLAALVEFAPVALMLGKISLEDRGNPSIEIYYATAYSLFCVACCLVQICFLVQKILLSPNPVRFVPSSQWFYAFLAFTLLTISVYGFLLEPAAVEENFFISTGGFDDKFFTRFLYSSRFEALYIAFAAVMIASSELVRGKN